MDQIKFFKSCFPQILLGPFLNTYFLIGNDYLVDIKTFNRRAKIVIFENSLKIRRRKHNSKNENLILPSRAILITK